MKRRGRKYINLNLNKSLYHFDVWRCTDRSVLKGSGKDHCVGKMMIVPAHLIKLFGTPDSTEIFFNGTG
jgi:hypothetical protein